MNNLYKKLVEYCKYKKILCIGTEVLNINNFPYIMKEYIDKGLSRNEKVIIFTDDILYRNLEKIFYSSADTIIEGLNNGNLKIVTFNPFELNSNSIELLNILNYAAKTKENLRILWDFKNVVKRIGKLKELNDYIENIFSYCNSKVYNMVYINNYNYSLKSLEKFCGNFESIVIYDRNREISFDNNEDLHKTLWLIQSNAQLKYQNNNLVLFNDMFSNIPKTSDKDEFKSIVINKLKDICNVDFCVIYTTEKLKENIIGLDSCYGVTKKQKYYMINDRESIEVQRDINNKIIESCNSILVHPNDIKNTRCGKIFKLVDIDSSICVYVDYYDYIKGVVWIGRYGNNKKIIKEDIEYIESICKTAFYVIQEQNRFADLQNKLIENEKLRAMGEMAAGISHDINNILTPIIGSIQLLKDTEKNKDIIKQLKIIEICAYDGMNIANKVKKFTKSYNNDSEFEIFEIDEVLLDAIDLTKNKWLTETALNGININSNFQLKSKAKVKGNVTELREVFINIIRNAIDAMPYGGNIEIFSYNKERNAVIELRDTGVGMNEEIIKRAFEPFFTTKGNKGSGIGLSVSYKIIQCHGGSIKIESKENIGTCFRIELPICYENTETKNNIKDEIIDFKGNVLVVDDQQQIRSVVADMIKAIAKCKIKACGNVNIQEEINRRSYDIIVCDFSMPDINGLQVADIAKNINRKTYFCLMTGWVGNFDKKTTKNVDFILNKPINKEKLKELFINYKNKRTIN